MDFSQAILRSQLFINSLRSNVMTTLLFTYTDRKGQYQEAVYGDEDMETCLDALTQLVNHGFSLNKVYLIQQSQRVELPVEAFDGQDMSGPIRNLQEQWETILC